MSTTLLWKNPNDGQPGGAAASSTFNRMSTEVARHPSPRPHYNEALAHLHEFHGDQMSEDPVDMDLWMDTIIGHGVYDLQGDAADDSMETVDISTEDSLSIQGAGTTCPQQSVKPPNVFAEATKSNKGDENDPFDSAKRFAKRPRMDQQYMFAPSNGRH